PKLAKFRAHAATSGHHACVSAVAVRNVGDTLKHGIGVPEVGIMTEPPAGPAANESAANDPIDQSATTDASVTDETHATTAAAQRRAYAELARSDDFRELRRRYRGFVFPWTIAFLAWYVLYVFCAMWAPGLMRTS